MKSAHRRQLEIALALKDYADMTGSLPEVTTEAVIRLRREGMTDCSHPATVRRFRELIDAITEERKRVRSEQQKG